MLPRCRGRWSSLALMARSNRRQVPACLFSSSVNEDLVFLDTEPSSGVATLTMNRPPVNSLSLEMCQAISEAIQKAESDERIQALILKSSKPSIFSAGLDLTELYEPDEDHLREYWSAFQQVYFDLYGSRLACIAAMEGHAPAGGCMVALSCDYRILAGPSTADDGSPPKKGAIIGLNGSRFGIVAPPWFTKQFVDTVGRREAELGLTLGRLYSAEQALDIGLVDAVVPQDEVVEVARQQAQEYIQIPPKARVDSKMLLRKSRMEHAKATRAEDLEVHVRFFMTDECQSNLASHMQKLSGKNK